jgi:hypothetical protein
MVPFKLWFFADKDHRCPGDPTDAAYLVSVPPLVTATLTCSSPVQTVPLSQRVGPLFFAINVKNNGGKDPVTGLSCYFVAPVWCHVPSTQEWKHSHPFKGGKLCRLLVRLPLRRRNRRPVFLRQRF